MHVCHESWRYRPVVALIHLCCLAVIGQKKQFTGPSAHSIHLTCTLSVGLIVSVEEVTAKAAAAQLMCVQQKLCHCMLGKRAHWVDSYCPVILEPVLIW